MKKGEHILANPFSKFQHYLLLFALVIFFYIIFDGTLQYVVAVQMAHDSIPTWLIGLLIGSSSLFGLILDVTLVRFIKNTNYRRMFWLTLMLCLAYPAFLFLSHNIWMYLITMFLWGLYWDVFNYGVCDYVSMYTPKKSFSSSYGIVTIFRSGGQLVAPLIAGFVVGDGALNSSIYYIAWCAALVAMILFIIHQNVTKNIKPYIKSSLCKKRTIKSQLSSWKKLIPMLWPGLCVIFFVFVLESFIWTLLPIYNAETGIRGFNGILITVSAAPALITGWLVGKVTYRLGKKKTAFWGMIIGSALLSLFAIVPMAIMQIPLLFCMAFFTSVALPSINGAFSDYISESAALEQEIESLIDVLYNLGYFLGPITAGILAGMYSIPAALSILGIGGLLLGIFLLFKTPKSIVVSKYIGNHIKVLTKKHI